MCRIAFPMIAFVVAASFSFQVKSQVCEEDSDEPSSEVKKQVCVVSESGAPSKMHLIDICLNEELSQVSKSTRYKKVFEDKDKDSSERYISILNWLGWDKVDSRIVRRGFEEDMAKCIVNKSIEKLANVVVKDIRLPKNSAAPLNEDKKKEEDEGNITLAVDGSDTNGSSSDTAVYALFNVAIEKLKQERLYFARRQFMDKLCQDGKGEYSVNKVVLRDSCRKYSERSFDLSWPQIIEIAKGDLLSYPLHIAVYDEYSRLLEGYKNDGCDDPNLGALIDNAQRNVYMGNVQAYLPGLVRVLSRVKTTHQLMVEFKSLAHHHEIIDMVYSQQTQNVISQAELIGSVVSNFMLLADQSSGQFSWLKKSVDKFMLLKDDEVNELKSVLTRLLVVFGDEDLAHVKVLVKQTGDDFKKYALAKKAEIIAEFKVVEEKLRSDLEGYQMTEYLRYLSVMSDSWVELEKNNYQKAISNIVDEFSSNGPSQSYISDISWLSSLASAKTSGEIEVVLEEYLAPVGTYYDMQRKPMTVVFASMGIGYGVPRTNVEDYDSRAILTSKIGIQRSWNSNSMESYWGARLTMFDFVDGFFSSENADNLDGFARSSFRPSIGLFHSIPNSPFLVAIDFGLVKDTSENAPAEDYVMGTLTFEMSTSLFQ